MIYNEILRLPNYKPSIALIHLIMLQFSHKLCLMIEKKEKTGVDCKSWMPENRSLQEKNSSHKNLKEDYEIFK